jgi:disulfide bond formation protein DsbB
MNDVLRPFLDRWRLCALAVAAAMLSIAHAFETFGGFAPCTLCLRQREVYWAIAAFAAIFMVAVRLPDGPRFREATCWIIAALFLAGAGVAAYHAGAEWKFWPGPTACSADAGGPVNAASVAAMLNSHSFQGPRCDEAPWVFAGLSMAGWNAVLSLLLAALSVAAAFRERSKR